MYLPQVPQTIRFGVFAAKSFFQSLRAVLYCTDTQLNSHVHVEANGTQKPQVRDGQTQPHRPRLVVSHSTCPPLSSSPHAHSFVIGPAVIKHTQPTCSRPLLSQCSSNKHLINFLRMRSHLLSRTPKTFMLRSTRPAYKHELLYFPPFVLPGDPSCVHLNLMVRNSLVTTSKQIPSNRR